MGNEPARIPPFRRWFEVALLMLMLSVTACSEPDKPWHGKDITGIMPDLEYHLTGPDGQPTRAGDYAGQVRLLFFGYTSCPDVCPTTLAFLNRAVEQVPAPLQNRITTLFVSVDPARDTPERLSQYVSFFGKHIVGLTGDETTLRTLAKRYRTTFGYGERDDAGNYEVSHSNAVYVFDNTGKIRLLIRSGLTANQLTEDLTRLARQADAG